MTQADDVGVLSKRPQAHEFTQKTQGTAPPAKRARKREEGRGIHHENVKMQAQTQSILGWVREDSRDAFDRHLLPCSFLVRRKHDAVAASTQEAAELVTHESRKKQEEEGKRTRAYRKLS